MEPTKERLIYAWGGNIGNHGNKYEEDLALVLFERASFGKSAFKLASEMKDAGKFDDVVIIFEEQEEIWLIQTKHKGSSGDTKPLSFDNFFPKMFKENKDFALVQYIQSYLDVIQKDKFKKYKQRFFILTNRSLDVSDEQLKKLVNIEICEQSEVNPIMKLAKSDNCYIRFRPKEDNIEELLNLLNTEITAIRDAIIELFKSGKASDLLTKYKTPMQKILTVLAKNPNNDNSNSQVDTTHQWLYNELLNKIDREATVNIIKNKAYQDLMKGKSRDTQLPPYINEERVNKFFQHLTFCIDQPSDLMTTVKDHLRSWMRTWIPPDDLGKAQLELPFFKFYQCFKDWINLSSNKHTQKIYLTEAEGRKCVKDITEELSHNLSQRESSYIERKLIDNSHIVSDHDFIKRLIYDQEESQFSLLIGKPGIGKTTILQYIAFEVQKKSDIDVFLIYLNSLQEMLKTGCENLETVYTILKPTLSKTSMTILKNNLESNANRSIIMFDGFDEITFHDEAIAMFKQILSKKNIRVIVSGRYHVKGILETAFGAGAIRLIPFEKDEQMMLLKNSWKTSDDSEEFKNYSTKLFENFCSDITSYEFKFFGISLMIRLLAEAYSDDFQQYVNTVPDQRVQNIFPTEKFNVVSLFKKIVQFSFQIKCKKNRSQDAYRNIDMQSDEEENRQLKYFIFEHQIAAWNQILRYNHEEVITSGEHETIYNDLQNRIKNGKENSPLFNISYGNLRFIHLSYAEFFAAMYIYDYIKKCKAILYETLVDHETVRRFFFKLTEEQYSEQSEQMIVLSDICKDKSKVAFWACESSSVKVVKELLQKNDFKTRKHEKYGSLLHTATYAGNSELVLFLLDYGIDANLIANFEIFQGYDKHLNTSPLHIASKNGHLEIAKFLLDRSANVDLQDENNRTPLHYASANGHLEIVKLLLDRSACVDLQDKNKRTSLHYASENGHFGIAKLLLDKPANVDLQDKKNRTTLHYASKNGHLEIVKLLLDRSATVDLQDENNRTSLLYASKNGHLEIAKLLLYRSANVDHQDEKNKTPLHYASKNGHLEIAELLLDRFANVDLQDEKNRTPLHYASKNGHLEIAKLLLDRSANVDLQDENNRTPLHYASENGHLELAELLLDENKRTPLHYASENGHLKIGKLLLDRSANVDHQDENNRTPLHNASENGHLKIAKLFLYRSANVDLQDENNKTPLHHASENGHLRIAKLLLDRSANVDLQDENNKTPLHHASENGHLELAKLLLDRSANVDLQDEKK
ncbi:uncharacterized protein LOC135707679 [Ochlerotatus camptorhynchus]|uniref:uncharacterized protein LOC135707679 n=1 Tax=Ochlerotatus camptorhynchus TaxID=644619 RepID=UPI0031D6DE96